jgi:hypothetical protein
VYRPLLAALATALLSLCLTPVAGAATATTYARSQKVAMVPGDGSTSNGGTLPTYGTVIGRGGESFDQFDFTDVGIAELDAAMLSSFDTLVLNEVLTDDLDAGARAVISAFVTGGGKLLIHDSDGTHDNDYSWLPAPARTGQSCPDCGKTGGLAQVVENNNLVSANKADASFVDVSELPGDTDAVGDANVMVSQDDHWFKDIVATNGVGDTGAVHTYATVGGLIIFNGFDTDDVGSAQASGVSWLAHMWFRELAQGWSPDGLPHGTPLNCSNTVGALSPSSGQVPIAGQPGTTVTITGKSFCPGTKVQFGNKGVAVDATVQNTGQMTVTVPRDAASGPLILINPDGQRGPGAEFPVNSYRNTSAFSFLNPTAAHNEVVWDDVAASFGDNAYDFWSLCSFCPTIKSRSDAAKALLDDLRGTSTARGSLEGGLCFGMSLGSLRLTAGLDPFTDGLRTDPQWAVDRVFSLPGDATGGAFGTQMRHYLIQRAMRQYSWEHYSAVAKYLSGGRRAPNQAKYLSDQLTDAFAHGLGIIEIFAKGGGHALVPYDMQTAADGSLDIAVYDSNRPHVPDEIGDHATHVQRLNASRLHVDSGGNWRYAMASQNGDVEWTGEPRMLRVVGLASIKGALSPSVDNAPAFSSITFGASVSQVADGNGRVLYDAQGELTPEDQRPGVDVMPAITGSTAPQPWSAPTTSLLLDNSGVYTETVAEGTLKVLGHSTDGQITSAGGQVRVWPGGRQVQLTPNKAGPAALQLTSHAGGTATTVAVSGRLSGATTLNVSGTTTVTVAKPQTLKIALTRTGLGQPPRTVVSSVRLGEGQRLSLGRTRRLRTSGGSLHVTVSKGHRRRAVTLTGRSAGPRLRILKAVARRGSIGATVTVQLATSGAGRGQVAVSVRGAVKRAVTVQAVAKRRVTVRLTLGRQRKHQKVRVWAVALSSRGRASQTATATVRAR